MFTKVLYHNYSLSTGIELLHIIDENCRFYKKCQISYSKIEIDFHYNTHGKGVPMPYIEATNIVATMDTKLDKKTEEYLRRVGEQYYFHLLGRRREAGRFLTEKDLEQAPTAWPYTYQKKKR